MVEAKVFEVRDPGLPRLAQAAEASALMPAQIEHDIDWLAESDHGQNVSAAVVGLYESDGLAGYVPLRYRSDGLLVRFAGVRLGRLPYRMVELFGPGVVARHDGVIPQVLAGLETLPWPFHAVSLQEIPTESPLWQAISAGGAGGFQVVERERAIHHVVDLPRDLDAYLGRFSAKTRGTWKRKAKKLEAECGPLTLRVYHQAHEVVPLLTCIEPVFRLTYHYHLLGRDLSPGNERLVGNLRRWADRGWLRAFVLFGGDRPLAYVIGCVNRRRYSYDMPGYDPRLSPSSPGIILLLRLVEELITHDVADVLDFGGGHADYKQLLATRSYEEANALLIRRTPYAQGVPAFQRALAATARTGAHVLERYQLKSRAKNWLRRRHLRGG
jgi:hypothetical protein